MIPNLMANSPNREISKTKSLSSGNPQSASVPSRTVSATQRLFLKTQEEHWIQSPNSQGLGDRAREAGRESRNKQKKNGDGTPDKRNNRGKVVSKGTAFGKQSKRSWGYGVLHFKSKPLKGNLSCSCEELQGLFLGKGDCHCSQPTYTLYKVKFGRVYVLLSEGKEQHTVFFPLQSKGSP